MRAFGAALARWLPRVARRRARRPSPIRPAAQARPLAVLVGIPGRGLVPLRLPRLRVAAGAPAGVRVGRPRGNGGRAACGRGPGIACSPFAPRGATACRTCSGCPGAPRSCSVRGKPLSCSQRAVCGFPAQRGRAGHTRGRAERRSRARCDSVSCPGRRPAPSASTRSGRRPGPAGVGVAHPGRARAGGGRTPCAGPGCGPRPGRRGARPP